MQKYRECKYLKRNLKNENMESKKYGDIANGKYEKLKQYGEEIKQKNQKWKDGKINILEIYKENME